jgi:hypothetical protein
MASKLEEYKKLIEEDVSLLGYEELRYSFTLNVVKPM